MKPVTPVRDLLTAVLVGLVKFEAEGRVREPAELPGKWDVPSWKVVGPTYRFVLLRIWCEDASELPLSLNDKPIVPPK